MGLAARTLTSGGCHEPMRREVAPRGSRLVGDPTKEAVMLEFKYWDALSWEARHKLLPFTPEQHREACRPLVFTLAISTFAALLLFVLYRTTTPPSANMYLMFLGAFGACGFLSAIIPPLARWVHSDATLMFTDPGWLVAQGTPQSITEEAGFKTALIISVKNGMVYYCHGHNGLVHLGQKLRVRLYRDKDNNLSLHVCDVALTPEGEPRYTLTFHRLLHFMHHYPNGVNEADLLDRYMERDTFRQEKREAEEAQERLLGENQELKLRATRLAQGLTTALASLAVPDRPGTFHRSMRIDIFATCETDLCQALNVDARILPLKWLRTTDAHHKASREMCLELLEATRKGTFGSVSETTSSEVKVS